MYGSSCTIPFCSSVMNEASKKSQGGGASIFASIISLVTSLIFFCTSDRNLPSLIRKMFVLPRCDQTTKSSPFIELFFHNIPLAETKLTIWLETIHDRQVESSLFIHCYVVIHLHFHDIHFHMIHLWTHSEQTLGP